MKETEIKILNIDSNKIRKILKKNNAILVKNVFQKNYAYSNNYTKEKKMVIRVRDEGKNNNKIFTVKGPRKIVKGCKVRTEHEIKVTDDATLTKMLKMLGYKMSHYCEMKREYYKMFNCLVEIIKFPKIPDYLEIEGDMKGINKIASILGYNKKDYYAKSIFEAYNLKKTSFKF
ncbi:CYTH domain-containing protein [Candidatus Pacearchaeota archaeon]|nr:CYTH domain-containing protein [Candidatus Pacearchaeota archaeon]